MHFIINNNLFIFMITKIDDSAAIYHFGGNKVSSDFPMWVNGDIYIYIWASRDNFVRRDNKKS